MLMACPELQQAFLCDDRKSAQGPLGFAIQQAFRHAAKGEFARGWSRLAMTAMHSTQKQKQQL